MPDASIKGIEVEVQASTSNASASIDKLTSKLAKLKSSLGDTKSTRNFAKSMEGITKATGKTLAKFSNALIKTPIKALTERVKAATGAFSKLGAAFKRIVFYRFIRSVIREIGDAFKYGVNNLYAWSQAADGRFAASMDRISTAFAYFKNSIGAAVAPLINALAPAIDYVIDKAVALLNVINQLFARLTGATYWTKAIKQANAYGDAASSAGGAAKEALRYLAPFDELNVLPSDNGSGGGGGGGGASGGGLFEIQQDFSESVSNFAQMVKDAWNSGDWEEVGRFLGGKVNDLINNLPWATMGANVGKFINALFGTTYWTLDTINFTNLGNKIAEFVNNAIANVDWNIAGRLSVKQFTVILDTIIGFIEGLDWDLVASSISEFVGGAISEFDGWMDDQDWSGLGTTIGSGINKILTETPWEDFIPSMVTFATDILTAINSALAEIHWGPWNEEGTVLNKLYNGLSNADWSGLWEQAKQLIKNTWPVWTLALAINLLPSIGSVVGAITKTAILGAIFGDGATAGGAHLATGAATSGLTLLEGGVLALEVVTLISLVTKLADATDTSNYAQLQKELGAETYSTYDEALKAAFEDPANQKWMDTWYGGSYAAKMPVQLETGEWVLSDDGKTTISDLKDLIQETATDEITWSFVPLDVPVNAQVVDVDTSKLSSDKKNIPNMNAGLERRTLSNGVLSPIEGMTAGFGVRKVDSVITKDPVTGFTAGFSTRTVGNKVNAPVTGVTMGFGTRTLGSDVNAPVTGRTMGFKWRSWDSGNNVFNPVTGRTMGFKWRNWDSGNNIFNPITGMTMGFKWRNWDNGNNIFNSVNGLTMGFSWRTLSGNVTAAVDTGASFGYYSRDWSGAPWVNVSASVMALGGSLTTSRTTVGAIANPLGFASGGVMTKSFWKALPKYAGGTRNAHGSLFVAGEAGPEVLGHIGGRTEVLNQSQLAATMFAAVRNAMAGIRFSVSGEAQTYEQPSSNNEDNMVRAIITALQTLGIDGDALSNVQAHISDREVYASVKRSNDMNTRMTGVNAFA